MPGSAEIWLGDLARAVAKLAASQGDVPAIRAMLGLSDVGQDSVVHQAIPAQSEQRDRSEEPPAPVEQEKNEPDLSVNPTQDSPDDSSDTGESAAEEETRSRSVGLEVSSNVARTVPWHDVPALPSVSAATRRELPHTPLFPSGTARGILQELLSYPAAGGEVDIPRVVRQLAAAKPVRALPRRPRSTLRFGVQLMVDHAAGMAPFRRDQKVLVQQVVRLVGAAATSVWHFAGSPVIDIEGTPYRLPAARTVLVVSGFGMGPAFDGRHDPVTWRMLTDAWRAHGVLPLALVPAPRHRFPTWLTTLMPVVSWDRGTTVASVRAALDGWIPR